VLLLTNAGITKDSDLQENIIGLHLIKGLGKSEEIVTGFIFLASFESSFMTGTTLEIIDGYLTQ